MQTLMFAEDDIATAFPETPAIPVCTVPYPPAILSLATR